MTDLERIDAAIEDLPHVGSINSDNIYLWFHANRKTILEALRVYAAVLGEPSDAVLLAGHRNAYTDNGILTLMAAYKAMTAEIVRQAKGK